MVTIVPTLMTGSGQRTLTQTTLTPVNTFVYKPGTGQILILRNATAGVLTPVLDGGGGTTVPVAGIGNVSVAAGFNAGSVADTCDHCNPTRHDQRVFAGRYHRDGLQQHDRYTAQPKLK